MMAQAKWVNKKSIMEDLSLTQGNVKIDADHTIGITDNEKPPTQLITEETEEEYFGDCIGDGVFREPDYEAIHKYLSLVNDIASVGDGDGEEEQQHVEVELTKTTEVTPVTIPNNDNKITEEQAKVLTIQLKSTINKERRNRNAAIVSILKVYAGVAPNGYQAPEPPAVILLKPDDFTEKKHEKKPEVSKESIQEVTISSDENKKISPVLCSANMFRMKSAASTPPNTASCQSPSVQCASPKAADGGASPLRRVEQYEPSGAAEALYRKYEANREVREASPENMWTQLKKKMQAVDLKKRQEKERKDNEDLARLADQIEREAERGGRVMLLEGVEIKPKAADGGASPLRRVEQYEPSGAAEALYRKYEANREVREASPENMWTQLKKKMQAVDLKKRQEKERKDNEDLARLADQIEREAERGGRVVLLEGVEITLPGSVCLPRHRHSLAEACVVCEVLCGKGQASLAVALPDEQ